MAQAATATRDRMLDGIRGYAIVLVLLSHTWIVAGAERIDSLKAVTWLFSNGDYAVTIFFVVSGFLATRSMLKELDTTGKFRPLVTWLRRWIRISAHVYSLVVVVLVMMAVNWNMLVAYQHTNTRESAFHIVTYTWNGYVLHNALAARPDLGHLWYVCTDLWVIGLIVLAVFLVGRWRPALIASLATALLVVMLYRQHVYETEGVYAALIRVQTRADGLLWGALAAAVLPWAQRLQTYARPALIASTLLLIPLLGAVVDESGYFGLGGWLLNIDMFVFVLAVAMATPPRFLTATVGFAPLRLAGRYSLVLYIWHYPLFWYLSKDETGWAWGTKTFVAYALTLVIAIAAQVVIERPTQRWLRSEKWHALDDGVAPALLAAARRGRDEAWARLSARPADRQADEPVIEEGALTPVTRPDEEAASR
jgi:peptidoglycan/LPS O-acetylase OafA/YrhL